MLSASMSMSNIIGDIDNIQAIIVCIVICIGTLLLWRWQQLSHVSHHNRNAEIETDDNGCNNPNCIRCHSTSQHHIQTFQANVTTLRRLVKLEPTLFDGMRNEIWVTIDEMERQMAHTNSTDVSSSAKSLGGLWWRLKRIFAKSTSLSTSSSNSDVQELHIPTKDTSTKNESTNTQQLSPQLGQDPTVLFLPGLEATPYHHRGHFFNNNNKNDKTVVECPCNRLWKHCTVIPPTPPKRKPPLITLTGDMQVLQENCHIIRQELLDFLSSSNSNNGNGEESFFTPFDSKVYTQVIASDDDNTSNQFSEWSAIYLYRQGLLQTDICNKYFPLTTNILQMKCPHRMAGKCGLGSVYFSKLTNNTKVKEHCGPTNIRWRCHLPLIVPKESNSSNSYLKVGLPGVNEQCVGWKEGLPILFDDSFLHSAVHNVKASKTNNLKQDDARVVLIIDFWHPSLSESDRNALGVLYPPGS